MTLKELKVTDLYDIMDELDKILKDINFNSYPFVYRMGVKRMRNYLDHVTSGLRMMNGGRYEPHDIQVIHHHNRNFDL